MAEVAARLPLAPLAPLDAPAVAPQLPAPAIVAPLDAPAAAPQLPAPVVVAPRAALDSLTLELIEEAPRVPAVAAPREAPAAPVVAPPAPAARAARPRGVSKVLLGLASAAVLAAVVLAPRLRLGLAGPARQVDGTPAPVPTNFDAWRDAAEGNWLI